MDAREVVERFASEHEESIRRDGDAVLCVYFSKEQDRFRGFDLGMDVGDALIVIKCLVERFDLSREALQEMFSGRKEAR